MRKKVLGNDSDQMYITSINKTVNDVKQICSFLWKLKFHPLVWFALGHWFNCSILIIFACTNTSHIENHLFKKEEWKFSCI